MTERRLAAIGMMDVAGYSRMMAEDEEGTHAALKAHLNAADPILFNHGGRIVKRTGDGMLFELPSVVEAVRAAVEAQQLMAMRNASIPEGRRMHFRIGLNLGDVIVDDDGDIHGDGVNVAARLEAMAPVGGICIADNVYRQVRDRLDVDFEDLGPQPVKGLPDPVQAWRVRLETETQLEEPPVADTRRLLASVAVLPFANMSGDADQEYFADGIAEDLITMLSHFSDLAVVSRNSSFAYKEEALDVRRIARELDATYVVEGSVRRAGDRVRVSAQLIDADSGHHVWADRYDRELDDVFALQDEIVGEIAGHILPELTFAEGEKRDARPPADLDAWDLLLKARWASQAYTEEAVAHAIELAQQAVELDLQLADAHAELSAWWLMAWFSRWRLLGLDPRTETRRHAQAAFAADPTNPRAMAAMAWTTTFFEGKEDEGVAVARRAVSLAPHSSLNRMVLGVLLIVTGDDDTAVVELTEAWRLGQHETWRVHIATNLSNVHYLAGRYDSALAWAQRGLRVGDYLQLHMAAAVALAQLGRSEEAGQHLAHLTRTRPDMTATRLSRNVVWKDPEDVDHYLQGLIKAGLPE